MSAEPPVKKAAKVLVVDDEPDYRRIAHDVLSAAGMEVRQAEDGAAGLEALRSFPADVVLVDWLMPKMNGEQFCRALRGDPRTCAIPVVMLTVKQSSGDQAEALCFGVDDYLFKPFAPEELVARVRAALTLSKGS